MRPLQQVIVKEQRVKLIFFLGALSFLFLALLLVKNLLVSVLIAFVTYFLLSPAVDFLERRGFSRQWATVIPFLTLTLLIFGSIQILIPTLIEQSKDLQSAFPKYIEAGSRFLSNLERQISSFMAQVYPIDVKGEIEPRVTAMAQSLFQNVPDYISQSVTVFFLAPFLAYFMLTDGPTFMRKLLALVPNRFFELGLHLNYQISGQLGGFIRARILESALVGLVIWIGLLIMGFPFALILAVIAGIMNVIPYLGPFIGVAPAVVIHLANGGSTTALLWLLFIYALAQILDIVLIVPFVVAKIVDLHPVTVVLAVIVGSQMMGILGMIISIPLFSALKVSAYAIYKHLTDFRS
jgi:putative permease